MIITKKYKKSLLKGLPKDNIIEIICSCGRGFSVIKNGNDVECVFCGVKGRLDIMMEELG